LWSRVPRHNLVQQLPIGFDRFSHLAGLCVVVSLGPQSIVGVTHGFDLVRRVSLDRVQQFKSAIKALLRLVFAAEQATNQSIKLNRIFVAPLHCDDTRVSPKQPFLL
jgi:hypothetical protein